MLKFLKNGCLTGIVLLLVLAGLGALLPDESDSSKSGAFTSSKATKTPTEVIDSGLKSIERTVIEYEEKGVDTTSESAIYIAASFFDAIGIDCLAISKLAFDGNQSEKKQDILRRATKLQKIWFPKIRDAYGPLMRKKLWENDMHVKTVGAGYSTVQFAHYSFVLNASKKEYVESIWSDLNLYRFKSVEIRSYEGEAEYAAWNIPSASDLDITSINSSDTCK